MYLSKQKHSNVWWQLWTSPAGVHHHNEFVSLWAVSNSQLDLAQGILAGGRATKNTPESVSLTSLVLLRVYVNERRIDEYSLSGMLIKYL